MSSVSWLRWAPHKYIKDNITINIIAGNKKNIRNNKVSPEEKGNLSFLIDVQQIKAKISVSKTSRSFLQRNALVMNSYTWCCLILNINRSSRWVLHYKLPRWYIPSWTTILPLKTQGFNPVVLSKNSVSPLIPLYGKGHNFFLLYRNSKVHFILRCRNTHSSPAEENSWRTR